MAKYLNRRPAQPESLTQFVCRCGGSQVVEPNREREVGLSQVGHSLADDHALTHACRGTVDDDHWTVVRGHQLDCLACLLAMVLQPNDGRLVWVSNEAPDLVLDGRPKIWVCAPVAPPDSTFS
jgi:hypothetical protein